MKIKLLILFVLFTISSLYSQSQIILVNQTYNSSLSKGELCYFKNTEWDETDADSSYTSTKLLGIALGNGQILIQGIWKTSGLSSGNVYYVSPTEGQITPTKPTSDNVIVKDIGWALSSTKLYFKAEYSLGFTATLKASKLTLDSLTTEFWNGTLGIDTLTYNWGIMDTTIVGAVPGWKVPYDITILEVSAYTDANTCTFNLEERGETTPNTAGTDVMSSDLVADNNQQKTTTFTNAAISKDVWLVPTISATGDVEIFSIMVKYVKNH